MYHDFRKKLFTGLVLCACISQNTGIIDVSAGTDSSKTKKELHLSQKYSGKKLERAKNAFIGKESNTFLIRSDKTLQELEKIYGSENDHIRVKRMGNGLYHVRIPRDAIMEKSIAEGNISTILGSETIVEPEIFEAAGSGSEYFSGEQLENLWVLSAIDAEGYQQELASKEKIKVGILDTGIDIAHPDLQENIDSVLSYDFITEASGAIDDNGHGTEVAGILGARVNGSGIYGVNASADIVPLKVLDADGLGTSYDVVEAIHYAIENKVKVLNLSFGGIGNPATSVVCSAITEAKNQGTLVVVAAGNGNTDVSGVVPAGCSDVITVGALGKSGEKATFSNYGTGVDVYAPGVDIYTTYLNQSYIAKDGTSFAAPIVAGLISKELAYNPFISSDEILQNIKHNYTGIRDTIGNTIGENLTYSGATTATGGTGSIYINPIDYSRTKYYSGIFVSGGKTYGNSLYDDMMDFSGVDMSKVQVYAYDEYRSLLSSVSGSFQTMSVPTNGLIAEYLFNGNGNDDSGYNNNGTPSNVTWTSSGGRSFVSFHGNSNIIIGDSSVLRPNYLTISVWVEPSSSVGMILGKTTWANANSEQYAFWISDFKPFFSIKRDSICNPGNAWYPISSSNTIPQYQWSHVVATFDGSIMSIYVNGVLQGTTSVPTGGIDNCVGGTLNIGSWWASDPLYYNGDLDNLRLYNRALSESEIQSLYQSEFHIVDNNTFLNLPTLSSLYFNDAYEQYNRRDTTNTVTAQNNTIKGNAGIMETQKNSAGDPVNLATGEFTYENTLMNIPGSRVPYELDVRYTNQTYYNGPLGINWDHNYNLYLSEEASGNILFYNGKLGVFRFIKNGSNFDYNIGLSATLSSSGGLYTLRYDTGKVYTFGANQKISKIADAYGDLFNFTYTNDLLTQVTDVLGRNISYTYYDHNRLKEVMDFSGRTVDFHYYDGTTASGSLYDLQDITINNGTGSTKTISFLYSTGGDDISNHNITELIDAKGQTYVENTYEDDRVKTQKYGTGTLTYTYTLSGSAVIENAVVDRLGNQTEYFYDTLGNNTELRQHAATGTMSYLYAYNTGGQLVTEQKPRGNGYSYTYDTKGHITEKRMKADILLANGTGDLVTSLAYDGSGNLTQSVEPNGKTTNFTYTGANLLTKSEIVFGTGVITNTFSYDTFGRLIQKKDGENNPTIYEYTTLSTPTKVKTGCGTEQSTTTYTYDIYGNPLTLTDGSGNVKTYTYDAFSRLATETTAEGVLQTYGYDANNNRTTTALTLSGTESVDTTTVYDILDLPVSVSQETSNGIFATTQYGYNANGDLVTTIAPNGLTETRTYNTVGKLATVTKSGAQLSTTSYTYDANGNLVAENTNGNITSYTYDLYDRLTRKTDAMGGYASYTYDKAGNILTNQFSTSTGLLMQETSYTYDILSRIAKTAEKKLENSTYRNTLYAYNKNHQKTSETNALSGVTSYAYDTLGRLKLTTLPNGLQYQNIYDKNSRILTENDISSSGAIATTYTYDRDGRKLTMRDALGNTTRYFYNKLGQVTKVTDPMNIDTTYTYDYLGDMLTESRVGKMTTYEYNTLGQKTKLTDALGNITNYTYKPEGYLSGETMVYSGNIQRMTSYTYDANGNMKTKTDPNGTKITYTYDGLNRMTGKSVLYGSLSSFPSVTRNMTYTYDALSNLLFAAGEVGFNLTFTYDSFGNLTKDQSTIFTFSNNLQYDILGRVTRIPYTQTIGYANITYDNIGRLSKVANPSNVSYVDYTYSQRSLIREKRKNTVTNNYLYDSLGRLSTVSGSGYTTPLVYTYDSGSSITKKGNNTYSYNSQNELTRTVYATGIYTNMSGATYSYDLMGNRQSESIILNATQTGGILRTAWNYSTGSQNTYSGILASSGLTYTGVFLSGTILYDANGNIIGNKIGSQQQYLLYYDYDNRIVKIDKYLSGTTKITIVRYDYDGLGRRSQRLLSAPSGAGYVELTYYGYYKDFLIEEKIQNMVGMSTDGNYIIKNYFYGPEGTDDIALILQKYVKKVGTGTISTITEYYLQKDHLGSPEKVTNASGTVIEEYSYTPFGGTYIKNALTANKFIPLKLYTDTILPTIPNGNTGTLYRNTRLFTGREYDTETGLYYLRARHYDPASGRFLQKDPIGTKDDVNLYRYVKNSPLNYTDPSGLSASADFARIFGNLYDQGYTDIYKDIQKEGEAYKKASQQIMETLPISGDVNDILGLFTSKSLYSCKSILGGDKAITILGAVLPFVNSSELRGLKKTVGEEFFEGAKYTDDVIKKMGKDIYHGFPSQIDQLVAREGIVDSVTDKYGKNFPRLSIPGEINGIKGYFEYIKNKANDISHRFFNINR